MQQAESRKSTTRKSKTVGLLTRHSEGKARRICLSTTRHSEGKARRIYFNSKRILLWILKRIKKNFLKCFNQREESSASEKQVTQNC